MIILNAALVVENVKSVDLQLTAKDREYWWQVSIGSRNGLVEHSRLQSSDTVWGPFY